MNVVDTRPRTLPGYGIRSVRPSMAVLLVLAVTALGITTPSRTHATTRKTDKPLPKPSSGHGATGATAPQHKKLKHKRHTKTQKTTTGTHGAKVAATHKSSKPTKHGKSQKPAQHAARTTHPHRVAVARRATDPRKLEIPQGDGSPVLNVAAHLLGRPYRFGADGGAFDCSGFVRTVFARVGVELPHSAREQFDMGDRVARDDLEPGDLVFFQTYRRSASHVGIYVGDDKFVHAATRGGQVQVDSLNDAYYAHRYLGARRIDI